MYVEQRQPKATLTELAADLALHLYTRQLDGTVVVVAEQPFFLLRIVRKEWVKLTRMVQAERAKSLDAIRIAEFTRQIVDMQTLSFTAKRPTEAPEDARVFFLEPSQIDESLPGCHTAYVTCGLDNVQQEVLKSRIVRGGLLVLYEPTSSKK